MSKFKMAGDMKWPIKRAEEEIGKYFKKFPSLQKTLNYFAWHGLSKGYITTIAPFFRKRYFPDIKLYSQEEINAHWKDIKYDRRLGEIERASKNMPIQGEAQPVPWLNPVNSVNPKAVKPREYRANTRGTLRSRGRCNDYAVSSNNNLRTKAGVFNEMSYLEGHKAQI